MSRKKRLRRKKIFVATPYPKPWPPPARGSRRPNGSPARRRVRRIIYSSGLGPPVRPRYFGQPAKLGSPSARFRTADCARLHAYSPCAGFETLARRA
jgi:hypothetical protein